MAAKWAQIETKFIWQSTNVLKTKQWFPININFKYSEPSYLYKIRFTPVSAYTEFLEKVGSALWCSRIISKTRLYTHRREFPDAFLADCVYNK